MKRIGKPEDIGMAAVFLCSEAAAYITGTCLPVDGGALIGCGLHHNICIKLRRFYYEQQGKKVNGL